MATIASVTTQAPTYTPTTTYVFEDVIVKADPVTPQIVLPVFDDNVIQKVACNPSDQSRFIEIRPPLRRLANETPFFVEMIDSNGQPCAIQYPDNTIVQALKMAPNPDSFVINSAKIVNRYNTMTRWVEEHWGDDMDTVNFSGSTFSFMAIVTEDAMPGLSVANRRDTEAYQMLKELVKFYRTNGCIYQDSITYFPQYEITTVDGFNKSGNASPLDTTNAFLGKYPSFVNHHPRDGLVRERLYIKITFDYVSFIGYFESFDITEDSANPFRFTYSAIFKAEKTTWIMG